MAIELSVTDGTTTVTLTTAGTCWPLSYTPKPPASADAPSVAETCLMYFQGVSTGRGLVASLNRLLAQARHYQQKKVGARVYVNFRPDGAESLYRSELLDGRIEWDESLFTAQWGGGYFEAALIWSRRPYWEGPETAVPLTNGNGTNNTSGLTVYNHNDADSGHDNYVDIAAAAVGGEAPAPLKLEIENSYNHATRADTLFIAHNVRSAPATFPHIVEGEDSILGTPTSDANASGGEYMARTWSGTAETRIYNWELSSALLAAAAGNDFRIIARFNAAPSTSPGTWIRFSLLLAGLTPLYRGPWILLTADQVQSLDTLKLPPHLAGSTSLAPLDLVIDAKRADSSNSLHIDFIQLSPIGDGWRQLVPVGYGLEYEEQVVDDRIEDRLYAVWTDGEVGYYVAEGEPLMLWPGAAQRLYFLHGDTAGGGATARTLSVRAWYRPRRYVL